MLPLSTSLAMPGVLFPSQYLSGMISLTPYLMVWDWRVSRADPMPFCWPSCSLLFCLQLFSLSLLFLYRLVVWGWGLRTDSLSTPSPGLALPIFFNNNKIIIIIIIDSLLLLVGRGSISKLPEYTKGCRYQSTSSNGEKGCRFGLALPNCYNNS